MVGDSYKYQTKNKSLNDESLSQERKSVRKDGGHLKSLN